MEKWEEEGFASEEAYNKYRQTVKDLEDKASTLQTQVDEKQKVIDSNRTKISDLSEVSKERDSLKTELDSAKEELEKFKGKSPEPKEKTPEQIAEENTKRIDGLSDENRSKLEKAYEEADAEKRKLLDSPEGMEVFLNLMLKDESGNPANPFSKKTVRKEEDLATRVAKAFNLVDNKNKGPVSHERKGAGFDLTVSEPVQKTRDEFTKEREAASARLLS